MINLRFHIVSIVAVFLALAIGILTGTTLLDQATVRFLENAQVSLEARNDRLDEENARLRESLTAGDATARAFDESTVAQLIDGRLDAVPVLVLAARGIDEDSVRATQTLIRAAGGSPLGIIWFDERFDLDAADAVVEIARSAGVARPEAATKSTVISALAEGLVAAMAVSDPTEAPVGETTTSVAPDTETTTTTSADAAAPTTTTVLETPTGVGSSIFSELVGAGLLDWDSPTDGEPGARPLPPADMRLVVIGGENAELPVKSFVAPLVAALAGTAPPVVVGEVRSPRSSIDAATQSEVPTRGAFVDRFRTDEELAAGLVTVDDLDVPFGRLALVLAMGAGPTLTSGHYGAAETAEAAFPIRRG